MKTLHNDKENRRVIYLGHDMRLSKKQYQIYCCIENSDTYVSAEQIIQECYTGKKPKKSNIVTHICYINRQAHKIGDDTLIVSKYGNGYKINDQI